MVDDGLACTLLMLGFAPCDPSQRGIFKGKGKGRADLAASDTTITPVGVSADTTLLYPNIVSSNSN